LDARSIFFALAVLKNDLCLRGEEFKLGAPLNSSAEQNLEDTSIFLQKILPTADLATWGKAAEPFI
jgi:hypothetical protein